MSASFRGAIIDSNRAAQTVTQINSYGTSDVAFARDIALGAPNNGFAVQVQAYSTARWNQLRLCLAPH
jgi:hypothetical protein